jgi:hypothetical protein
MTPMPPPYAHVINCGDCKSQLTITALRDDSPRTSTTLTISCPVCKKEAEVAVPLSIVVSSVQIAFYERPTVKSDPKHIRCRLPAR